MSGRTPIRPLAISMGDPAGIGPEIIAKSWKARELHSLAPFFVIGNPHAITAVWDGPLAKIGSPDEAAAAFETALPILPVGEVGDVVPGRPNGDSARVALQALEIGVGLARSSAAGALVTGPVSKAQLYDVGFTHPGQTEFVAERCGISADHAVMMLAGPTLRVVPMTVHVALAQVPALVSQDLILSKARVTARGLLRNFGIERPRLAFAGLNPHAGESGAIGREEVDILAPAIAQLREEGIDAVGPFSADTMFHARARAGYDAALCLYHDQALIPIKTLHFDDGVNITLGLPIVRTSPDHGTAFNIAGTDQADPGAMIAAIRMAQMAAERREATAAVGLP
ncbi:4-hydroxythreonine-4-phosphate dehydrogenase PdxA [Sphingomonas sp. IC-56]|uniref:4-hydroxythreonine-4-phosphate dehydrogenase PdxA n=1 Tax=Sphingomonas sp. IC-56 TaxID=2898529 RepID=UPI001E44C77A|nr:4-hydroxythreonine-4-phosphate dehydrogenase PdxA [Sphingomonas sp. IC-56]MCD2325354.1 4-hydroxythreonine-4-phosphate dehydrogenase PdxA [Sphingomonas sp. IC-56]